MFSPDDLVLAAEHEDAELLTVRLALGLDQLPDQGLCLLGVVEPAPAERDARILDQGHAVHGNKGAGLVAGGLGDV